MLFSLRLFLVRPCPSLDTLVDLGNAFQWSVGHSSLDTMVLNDIRVSSWNARDGAKGLVVPLFFYVFVRGLNFVFGGIMRKSWFSCYDYCYDSEVIISPARCLFSTSSSHSLRSQRKDEHVNDVVGKFSHVTVYGFEIQTQTWVRIRLWPVYQRLKDVLNAFRLFSVTCVSSHGPCRRSRNDNAKFQGFEVVEVGMHRVRVSERLM